MRGTMLFFVIFSALFCFVAALFMLFGALKGRKYKWQLSFARIIVVLVSAIASAILAAVISNAAISLVLNLAITNGWLLEVGELLAELPSGVGIATSLASMFIAPVLFLPLFYIIRPILNIFAKLIALLFAKIGKGKSKGTTDETHDENGRKIVRRKHYKKRYEALVAHYFNPLGALMGALCSLLVFCVLLVPMVGAIDVANDILPLVSDAVEDLAVSEESSEDDTIGMAVSLSFDAVNALDNSVGALTVKYTGGKLLYGAMTSGIVNGEMTSLNKEGAFLATVGDAAITAIDEEKSAEEKAAAIRDVSPAFDKSVVTRTLLSELCSAAGDSWAAGEDFHGIARPSLGGDFEAVFSAIIDVFATADSQNIKKDVHAITEAVAVVFESGVVADIQSDPMSVLGKEETTSALFAAFLADDRLDPMVDGFADFGVNILLDTIQTPNTREELYEGFVNAFLSINGDDAAALTVAYSDIFDDYGIRLDAETIAYAAECKLKGEDMNNWLFMHVAKNQEEFVAKTELISADMITGGVTPITNREHEADALAHAFAVVYGMVGDITGDSFNTKSLIGKFGPALDSFTMTETIGAGKTGLVLTAVLQSKTVHDQLGMSVIDATNTANSIVENSGKKDYATIMASLTGIIDVLEAASDKGTSTKEAVEKMLDNLTPEAANVMQTMATPNVVKNYGVPENNAEPVANIISNTFGNLQEVPAEEYDKEAAAVTDMMNVMMAMGSSGSNGTFGGEESDTQLSADEYVGNVMDSKAMSKTLVDTVYGEGDEPKVDPMNSGRNLGSNEKAELLESLNSKWAASPKDEATKRQIVAIAAMMNMVVEVTDAGVTEVVPA